MTPEAIRAARKWAQRNPDGGIAALLAHVDALIAAGDVLATRLDETPAPMLVSRLIERERAVRAWLAVAHPNGEGHKP
jgi:hypothetical protein